MDKQKAVDRSGKVKKKTLLVNQKKEVKLLNGKIIQN